MPNRLDHRCLLALSNRRKVDCRSYSEDITSNLAKTISTYLLNGTNATMKYKDGVYSIEAKQPAENKATVLMDLVGRLDACMASDCFRVMRWSCLC